ncbi:MAG: glycosyltransferase family 4 protein [Candidatus Woesearchaeota archaeon]
MRILIINKYCPKHPRAGGAEERLKQLCIRLERLGHEVYLLSARFPGSKDYEFYAGTHIYRIGLKNSYNTFLIHILGLFYASFFARKIKPDIVYEDISPLPWFTPLTMRKRKRVVIIHHINKNVFFKTQWFSFALLGYILEQSIRFFYKRERIITVGPSTTREVLKMGFRKENIFEIRDGVDVREYSYSKSKFKKPTVLFLGRHELRKGLDLLIKTYDFVKKEIPAVEYIILGDGKERKNFEKMAEGKEDIVFKGFVKGKKKIDFLKKSWVLAVPSRTEGYCIAVLEANACGTLAIGNNVEGLRDSIINNKTGFLVNCYDSKEFANKIIEVLKNKKLRETMSWNARKWAEKHDLDLMARKTIEIFEMKLKEKS